MARQRRITQAAVGVCSFQLAQLFLPPVSLRGPTVPFSSHCRLVRSPLRGCDVGACCRCWQQLVHQGHEPVVQHQPTPGYDGFVLTLWICLTNGGAGPAFRYDAPTITALNPSSYYTFGGIVITLTGTSMGTTQGSVTIGGFNCPLIAVSPQSHTFIKCTIPSGSGIGQDVVATVANQTSSPVRSHLSMRWFADDSAAVLQLLRALPDRGVAVE